MEKLLSTRARIVPGYYALIPQAGRMENVLPNLENGKASIMTAPKLGAGFVSYVLQMQEDGRTTAPFGGESGIELFLYVNEGMISITVEGEQKKLKKGGYVYTPPGAKIEFESCGVQSELFFYKNRYIPLNGKEPWLVWGDIDKLKWEACDGKDNLFSKKLLPSDLAFDIGFHILLFKKGGCHSFVETHMQEHGAYILQGQGMYLLDTAWSPVEKGDFIWMGAYVPQGAYAIGEEDFSYIFSQDCNRDVEL